MSETKKVILTKQNLTQEQIKSIYNKNYYYKHKVDKYETRKQAAQCSICSGVYNYYSKSRHIRTKKHLKALNSSSS